MNIQIDPEFKALIPPLTTEEYKQLEDNILKYGVRDSIVIWNGIIIDGHNRYEICQKHNITSFNTVEQNNLVDRNDVKEWIIENQLGRRNISRVIRTILLAQQYEIRQNKKIKDNHNKEDLSKYVLEQRLSEKEKERLYKKEEEDKKANYKKIVDKEIKKDEKAEKKEIKLQETKAAAKEILSPIGGDYQYKIGDCMEYFKIISDKSIDLILTDIPYNVVNRESNGLRNLNKGIADIITFDLDLFLKESIRVCKGSIYIFCGTEQVSHIRNVLDINNLSTRLCIWKKNNPSIMNGNYIWLSGIECCIYGKFPNAIFNEEGHNKNTVWEYPVVVNQIHPTQKNLELIKYLIKVSSHEGDLVLDPCMGSGVVLKASKELKRKFIGFELSSEWEYNYKNIICGENK